MTLKKLCFALAAMLPAALWAQTLEQGHTYLINNLVESSHFIQDSNGTLRFGQPSAKALWRFIPSESGKPDCFYVQNVETGKYIQTSTTVDVAVRTGDTPVEYHVVKDTSGGSTNGFWGLASTDQNNTDFKSGATIGLNDNINGYVAGFAAQQGNNRRSFWKIEEAADELPDEDLSDESKVYHNPVITTGVPDPTVIRADNGYYYLYATENPTRNVPIYRSANLVDWTLIGTVFTEETRPDFVESRPDAPARVWAPNINYVDGKYYLYYSMSRWGSEWECGIGVATADSPEGPFTNHGKMFISSETNTQNSIDPFFIEEDGHKYLFWGSFSGIWGCELTDDGLDIRKNTIQKIAGTLTEGTYIAKHDGHYYLFGSVGSCCDGQNSTYHVMVARSENLFGPYVDRNGNAALDNHFSHLLYRSDDVIGPGHNAELVQDDAGQWWMLYHGFQPDNLDAGRVAYLDRVHWTESGWPSIRGMQPSTAAVMPVITSDPAGVVDAPIAVTFDNSAAYNLQGQKVDETYNGIVVRGGRKIKQCDCR